MGVLAARQLGAERIIAMSRHPGRQELARFYGATDIVTERGDEGVAKIKELTNGLGAHSVIEAVGTQESNHAGDRRDPAWRAPELHRRELRRQDPRHRPVLRRHPPARGGPAPVRRFLPDLIQLIWDRKIDPGKVLDLTLPLDQAAEGYQAMKAFRGLCGQGEASHCALLAVSGI
jgi:threonine dehydrogenase-like Zn-dependent dehydrogenase